MCDVGLSRPQVAHAMCKGTLEVPLESRKIFRERATGVTRAGHIRAHAIARSRFVYFRSVEQI